MSFLNQVNTKCCVWKNYDHYITLILLTNKVKSMPKIFKF